MKYKVTCTVNLYAIVEADDETEAEELAKGDSVDMLVHSEQWNVFEEVDDER